MTKFLTYALFFCLLVIFILFSLYSERGTEITRWQTKFNAANGNILYLEKDIEKRNEKALEISKRMSALEREAEKSKDNCWNHHFSNDDPVLMQLHKD